MMADWLLLLLFLCLWTWKDERPSCMQWQIQTLTEGEGEGEGGGAVSKTLPWSHHWYVFWLMFSCFSCTSQAGVFMGFSITSAVMGGVIIICYSIAISWIGDYDYRYGRGYYSYDGRIAILAIMLILGIIAFGAGIWAAICACLMKPCACCGQPQVSRASAVSFWKLLRNSSQTIASHAVRLSM